MQDYRFLEDESHPIKLLIVASALPVLLISAPPREVRLPAAGRRGTKEAPHSMGRERPRTTGILLFMLCGLTNNSCFAVGENLAPVLNVNNISSPFSNSLSRV